MATSELTIILKSVDQASSNIKSIEAGLKNLAKSVVSIYALKQGFDLLNDAIDAAAQKQTDLVGLQKVIENTGISYQNVKGDVESFLTSIERQTMFTSSQLIPAYQQLINSGMNLKESMVALRAASELAIGNKRVGDITTAVNLLGKAYQGNTEQLKRYGIEADSFAKLMDIINSKFTGSNEVQLNTYNGQLKLLSTEWANMQEVAGGTVLPLLTENLNNINTVLGFVVDNTQKLKGEFEDMHIKMPNWMKKINEELFGLAMPLIGLSNRIRDIAGIIKETKSTGIMLSEKPEDEELFAGAKKSDKERTNLYKWLDEQEKIYLKITNFREQQKLDEYNKVMAIEQSIADETNQLNMSTYDYEMQMIQQTADAYKLAGADKNAVDKWASAQKIEALNKEFNLEKNVHKIVDVLAIGSAEQKKYLIADILEAEMLAQAKKFAWMAVEKLLMWDFAGAAIAAAEALALGYGASLIHAETDLQKSREKEAADAREKEAQDAIDAQNKAYSQSYEAYVEKRHEGETREQYEARYNAEHGIITGTSRATSGVTSIERAPAPTNNYYALSYNIYTGALLGDERTLDQAFDILMKRYESRLSLKVS